MELKDLETNKDVKAGSQHGGGFPVPKDVPPHAIGAWSGIRHPNGTSFLKSNLFIFLLGQGVMFAFWVTGFAVTYGQNTQKFLELTDKVSVLQATTKRMDESGTNFSHYGIESERAQAIKMEARLHEVEDQTRQIAVMSEKINRIDENLKELRSRPK
jgi:hypothetical protein